MKTENLSPLILDIIIQFLDTRPIGTKYHPRHNEYYVDARLMARVIRYNGNLMARVSLSESTFFSQLLQYLLREGSSGKTVSSSLHKGKYVCKNVDGFQRLVVCVKKVGVFYRGERAPLLPEPKEEITWA